MIIKPTVKLFAAGTVSALLTACTYSTLLKAADENTYFEPTASTTGIQLSGVFNPPDEWDLHLATPLLQSSQPTPESTHTEYWVRINDASEQLPVTVNEIATGPLHFTVAVEQADLPIRQLTLYNNDTQLQVIENEHSLPAIEQWLPMVRLAAAKGEQPSTQQEQLCLTWPDQLFEQASLLTVNAQGRLQVLQQSSASPLCVDPIEDNSTQLRVNLRNPMFAVQLTTNH